MKRESSEYEEDSYEEDSDSEGDFLPAEEGTENPNHNPREKEKKIPVVQAHQKRKYTEEKRTIPIIRTVKKEKLPIRAKRTAQTIYFPYDSGTKEFQFMFIENIPMTKDEFRKKE